MLKGILLFLQYLPEVISFIKWISKQIDKGVDHQVIKYKIKKIHQAFENPDPAQGAKELDDIFKN